MRVAANLNFLFLEDDDLLKRYEAAANNGFRYVEVPRPYDIDDMDQLTETVKRLKLKHVLIDSPRGNWKVGEWGMACMAHRQGEFRETIETAIKYAKALDCPRIHVLSGIMPVGVPFAELERTYIDNLKYACERMAKEGINCLVEPISTTEIPGYFMSSVDRAEQYIREIKCANLKMQYDVFHVQQICGQLTATIKRNVDIIDNIQIGQVPHRHEPDSSGEVDFDYFFKLLAETNSQWIIGAEYIPEHGTAKGLTWIEKYNLKL